METRFLDDWRVSSVPAGQIREVWPLVKGIVGKGLARSAWSSLTPGRVFEAVAGGDMELWLVHQASGSEIIAAVLLRANERPDGHALTVVLVTGRDFHLWGKHIQELVRDYAQIIGARTVQAIARPGMARWLAAMGWRKKATVMELSDG